MHTLFLTYFVAVHAVADVPSHVEPLGHAVQTLLLMYLVVGQVMHWLLLTYLFHTIGELTLSPIGLAAISNLSPKRYVGQMMGIWFLASSLGAIIAGLLSGQATYEGLNSMPSLFNKVAIISSIAGLVLILISKP